MQTITLSPDFELTLPSSICEALQIKPGQKMQVIQIDNRIELIPHMDVRQSRGFLKGMDSKLDRETDRL